MLKRYLPIASAIALMIGIGTGCQDSQVAAPQTSDATLQTGGLNLTSLSVDNAFDGNVDRIASLDDVLNGASLLTPPATGPNDDKGRGGRGGRGHGGDDTTRGGGDTTKGGGPHGDDTTKGDGRHGGDTTKGDGRHGGDTAKGGRPDDTAHKGGNDKRPPCLQDGYLHRILNGVQLTPAQATAIRGCQHDLKDCVDAATRRYHDAREGLFKELRAELEKIRDAVKNGRLTPEEGRRLWNAKKEAYRAKFDALQKGYQAALEHCCDEFNLCVRAALAAGGRG